MSRLLRRVLLFAFMLTAVSSCPVSAVAATASADVRIESLGMTGDAARYRIVVLTADAGVDLAIAPEATEAVLLVRSAAVRRIGRDVPLGVWPLGHATTLLSLAGVGPGVPCELRIVGSTVAPVAVGNVDAIDESYRIGALSGLFLAMLVVVAIFQIVTVVGTRDAATRWYIGFVIAVFGVQTVREGLIVSGAPVAGQLLLAGVVVAAIALMGFAASYLRLWRTRRPLFWAASAGAVSPVIAVAIYEAVTKAPVSNLTIVVPVLLGLCSLVGVAVVRYVEGFRPATFMLAGVLGLITVFVAKVYRDVHGMPAPFLDRFGYEIGMTFDVLVLSIGIAYRGRYKRREHAQAERELAGATFDAHHDSLTGLLNRRGLGALMDRQETGSGTVLYVDVDEFKAVNDCGGHAAGDATLSAIARVLTHAVRETDVVARVGGDEFVVVLPGLTDPAMADGVIAYARGAIAELRPPGCEHVRIGGSIGSGIYDATTGFEEALRIADLAAYRMKPERSGAQR